MNLITRIKEIPKKKLLAIALLTTAITATVAFAVIASQRQTPAASDGNGGEQSTVGVFKSGADSQSSYRPDTAEPVDTSGINGLMYVSHGDGTCHISGLGTCLEIELKIPSYSPSGDVVTKISDSAFENCTALLSITIPSTVKTIGTGAFRGCSSLVAINVDTENSVYCSVGGVLYSKDKRVLVSYPMNRPGNNFLIPDRKSVV